jgi:hypothetical protein
MTRARKKNDWRFTMEHIGRELRKLYPPVDFVGRNHQRIIRASAFRSADEQFRGITATCRKFFRYPIVIVH